MLCKGESEMPDSEELEKKEKREFMRETIVKPPLTRKQIAKRVALFVCASAVFGGVAAVSFAAVKPFADRCFQENGMQETSSVEFSKDDPDSVSPSDGADADMTAQPEQMEQEIDEAVSEALSSYQFSVDNFNSMTSVLRGIGELGDKSIVTVSSGKQDTDIFGNPVENTGDYAGAVIAESDGEFLIFTYADAVRAADSINVRFSDGTKIAGTVRQIDEVLGMAVVAVPSGNLPEEERKKVQVLSLANSYTVKAGDVLVGIGGPSGQVHSLSFGTVSYVARNVQITDGLTRILYADISSNSQTGTFLINTAGEMVGWTSESCRSESCTDRTVAYTISSYKPILERLTNGASAAYLGIQGQDVSRAMQGSGIPAGVYVTEAVSGSPAYDAGIQPGDIIVKFGTKEIGSFKDLQAQIENSASGVSVSVNVMRKGRDGYTEIPFLVSLRAR